VDIIKKASAALVAALALVLGGCGLAETVGAQTAPKSALPERVDLSGAFDGLGATLAAVEPSQNGVGAAVAAKAARLEAERIAAEKAAAEAAEKAAAEAAAKKKSSGSSGSGGSSGSSSSSGGSSGSSCAPNCGTRPGPPPPVEGGSNFPKCSTGANPCVPD
jgi:hypothetical protein